MAKLWAHVTDPPPSPSLKRPDLAHGFDEVVARATAKNPRRPLLQGLGARRRRHQHDRGSPELSPPTTSRSPTRPPAERGAAERALSAPAPAQRARPVHLGASRACGGVRATAPSRAAPSRRRRRRRSPRASAGGRRAGPPSASRATRACYRGRGARRRARRRGVRAAQRGGDDGGGGTAAPVVATQLPADLAWQPIASPPFQRQYAAATGVGKKLWVIGGIGRTSSSTTTKVYDTSTRTWATGPGLPLALHHHAAVTYKGEPVVIGGSSLAPS